MDKSCGSGITKQLGLVRRGIDRQLNTDPKRLLFVDDELGIRETMPIILRRHGFTVTVAATVAQAIREIRTQEFDILLSDLNIENREDGYVVVRAIREVNPNCVAIILTGHPGFDSVVEGIRQGVDDYVLKPARIDSLVALLAEKLAERKKIAATERLVTPLPLLPGTPSRSA